MGVTGVFSNIANGFQVLYSLFFEQMPEYAYRSSNNVTVRESDLDQVGDKQEMMQEQTAQTSTDHAPHYSSTENMSKDWVKISLNPILTIADVEELHNQLKQYLGKRVQLSGKNVQRIDTASLQLLLVFMLKADVTVCWVDYSAHLCESARLLGISIPLGLPTEIHG
ncbi:STAS domain-containing protein [Candidatus Albibeggiatoa sp. nov. BB20]|uniref:STAS domain-containing protein n=1 Tax=Candidatus Albibeggiatoa sp. nov. BB20 TaxID=3162723 RepID=UPI003365A404